ncbi:MAG: alpha/beta fold hydrolase [Pseudomonadota bacterium]
MSRTPLDATTAYYRSVPGVGPLRIALAFLQRLWPALAVRAACRLFLTPLPPKWLARGASWGADWRLAQLPFEEASVTLYEGDGDGPAVLLVHGWGGHAGQMKTMAAALRTAGMRPVIMEMPAHGRSAGLHSNLPQFARAIDYVVARLGESGRPVHTLIAHSLGATAAAFATARNLPIQRLVLLAPAASPPAYTRMFAQVFGLSERTRAAMQRRIEAREGVLMQHFEPSMLGARVRVPTLVVHDRSDTINPIVDGEAYVAAVAGATMHHTDRLGHRAILKDAAVVAAVRAFARTE